MIHDHPGPRLDYVASVCGLAGVTLILLGSLVSGLAYEGRRGEAYSPLNHFVSELGNTRYAARAWAFNSGLFVGGLLLTAFMMGVTARIRGWYRYLFGGTALLTGVALVGLLPTSAGIERHFTAAMTFFYAGMATSMLFSLYVLLWRQSGFSRWLALPGGITAICFFSLLFLVEPIIPKDQPDLPLATAVETALWNRPEIWQTAIAEWLVVLAVLGWVLSVSLYLGPVNRQKARQAAEQAR
jgi:hypothetical membrane protein